MPRLSTTGRAAQGVGTSVLSIDGAVPAALATYMGGAVGWMTPTDFLFVGHAGDHLWRLYTYSTTALTVTMTDPDSANDARCGNNRWAAFLVGSGVRTNVSGLGPFPAASVGDVSAQGLIALFTNPQQGSGVAVYNGAAVIYTAPVPLVSAAMRCRDGHLAYQVQTGWQLINLATGRPVSGFVARQHITLVIPFKIGGAVWVAEYETGPEQWALRPVAGGKGWYLAAGMYAYNMDVVGLGTDAQMAWAANQGESPDGLTTLRVNLQTGSTTVGHVVGGVLTLSDGPPLTAGDFTGGGASAVTASALYPPVQHPVSADDKTLMTVPWQAWARLLGKSVADLQTAFNGLPAGGGGGGGGAGEGTVASQTVANLDGLPAPGSLETYSRGDHKHGDLNRPTDNEKDALKGTVGDPSDTNRYVTDEDPRLAGGTGYDAPLTDGDLGETDLIFAGGECIIVQVPV